MNLTVGTKLHGFTVTRIRPIPGENAELVELTFDKTATPVCWLNNGEENKLFCIGFKTLPDDSTGVYHILEHSVLCGSEKYTVKEPFVELIKSSMSTFINAMTYPDKTIYPVSSRNRQDFLNLAGVYLDATLAPAILTNPNIFYQEGWHLETLNGEPHYNGVVFNEMKGATSDINDIIYEATGEVLFPDNGYGFNSGGDPTCIPDLTYEKFVRCYKENYHPTNARVYLDGDIPVDETLELIASYLGRYEMGSARGDVYQTPALREKTAYYDCPDADAEGKAHFVLAKITGRWDDMAGIFAAQILSDVIAGNNSAPLKKAILSAGLGQDVDFSYMDSVLQPYFFLAVKNTDEAKFDAIRKAVRETVDALVKDGLSKDDLTAAINRFSFKLRDGREPRALGRCGDAFNAWLYGGDPITFLCYDNAIEALRKMAEGDGFEKLLAEMFSDENLCTVRVLPSATHGDELRAKEKARVKAEMDAWTDADREANRVLCENLAAWQKSDDTAEDLATLPVLDLKEISDTPTKVETTETVVDGVTVYHHIVPSKGVIHFNLRFNLADRSLDELRNLAFVVDLLGKLPTKNYDAAAIQSELKKYVGHLRFTLDATAKVGTTAECTPWLVVTASALRENLTKAQELIAEVLTATDFDSADLIRDILRQSNEKNIQLGIGAGHYLSTLAVLSHYSAAGAAIEAFTGHTYVRWLHDFNDNFESTIGDFTALVKKAMADAVTKENLYMSTTHDTDADASCIIKLIPNGNKAPAAAVYTSALPKNYGIRIPGQANYACIGYHLKNCGVEYDGTMNIIENIVSYGYLWNRVRVQGGAYGCGLTASANGDVAFHSFRDPAPANSLKVYRETADYLRSFIAGDERLDKYIISTINNTDPLKDPRTVGSVEDARRLAGLTHEDKVKTRRELLAATKEKLSRWLPVFEKAAADGAVAVAAHAGAIGSCGDLEIVNL